MADYRTRSVYLPAALTTALQSVAHEYSLDFQSVLIAAWAGLLNRYSSDEPVIFGVSQGEASPLPLVIPCPPDKPIGLWLKEVQAIWREAQAHPATLTEIHTWSQFSPDALLFESLILINAGGPEDRPVSTQENYPLILKVKGEAQLTLDYASRQFDDEAITRLSGHLQQLLQSIAHNPNQTLAHLSLLTESERQQFIERSIAAPLALISQTIAERFEAQVQETPDRPAVIFEGQSLTYRSLNERANQLARHLQKRGVGPEALVGLYTERSLEMIVGLLGILKAGAGYVPVDRRFPPERRAYILEDAGISVLLTQSHLVADLQANDIHLIRLDTDWPAIAGESKERPAQKASLHNVAYVIYTSGSTGRPKGVVIEQQQILAYIQAITEQVGITPGASFAMVQPLAVDSSQTVIFPTFFSGGTLHIISEARATNPDVLAEYFDQHRIDLLKIAPSHLMALQVTNQAERVLPQRWLIVGGEASRRDWLESVQAAAPHLAVFNHYGPTETTVGVTTYRLGDPQNNPPAGILPIGRPLPGVSAYILDRRQQPAPTGIPGELYIGGPFVARGYLNRPELTAEKFIEAPLPLSPSPLRLYRTGDLARWLPDGNIEFLGRIDQQVKIRGFRIELGEIEAILGRHHAIRDAAIIADAGPGNDGGPGASGSTRLIAYFVPEGDLAPDANELRHFLRAKLPDYMIPAIFMPLDEMPRTPHGKLNRKALPPPDPAHDSTAPPYRAPRTDLERRLVQLWQETLGLARVGIDDNFFALGGDSLKGAIFINQFQALLGEYLYIVSLFEAPTVTQFATYLQRHYPAAAARVFEGEADLSSARSGRLHGKDVETMRRWLKESALLRHSEAGLQSAQTKNRPAIFILSPPRSGSTLLRVMLAGHPDLFAPPELALLPFQTLAERQTVFSGRLQIRLEGAIRAWMELEGCSAKQARTSLEQAAAEGMTTQQFYGHLQERAAGKILVDKTAYYALDLDTLRQAEMGFENACFIHLCRHPRGMIHSFEDVRQEQIFFEDVPPFPPRLLAELTWLISHQNIMAFLAEIPHHRQRQVRYEDLVNHPQEMAIGLAHFLGLEPHPHLWQPYNHPEGRMTNGLYNTPHSRMVGDVKFHQHQKIDPAIADAWRAANIPDFLSPMTWQVAQTLGYFPESPAQAKTIQPNRERQTAQDLLNRLDDLTDEEIGALLDSELADQEPNR
jgi:amino acid adenylation domain-containing protein